MALNFVVVFKEKYNTDGTLDKRPARITVNDGASSGLTYSGCVHQDMIRTLSQGAVDLGGEIKISDCWTAYYHGDPPDSEGPNGRHVYAFIPKEWSQYGLHAADPASGQKMIMRVDGKMSGRVDGARIFGLFYARFMTRPEPGGPALTQSIVDRRVFYKVNTSTKTLQFAVGVHVDENFSLVVDKLEHRKFEALWNAHFKKPATKPPQPGPPQPGTLHTTNPPTEPPPLTCQSFTGLRIQQLGGYVHHDSPRLMDSLQELFDRVPPTVRAKVDASAPLPKDALGLLRAEPPESNPIPHDQERVDYWPLQGMAGFIAG
jgi:hypothetical protein